MEIQIHFQIRSENGLWWKIFVLKIGSEFMAVDGYVDVESNNISRRFLHSYYKPSSRSVFMFKPSQRSRYLFRTNDRRILKQNIESQLYSTSGGLKREKVEDYFFLLYFSR